MPVPSAAINSTNVRNVRAIRHYESREETGRVLAVATALWGSIVGIALLEGAFERFEPIALALAAAFVSLFAVASYLLDPQLRAYADETGPLRKGAFAWVASGAFVVAVALGSAPFAMWLAPLAALGSVVVATTLPRNRARSRARPASSAKSPGANPAAT